MSKIQLCCVELKKCKYNVVPRLADGTLGDAIFWTHIFMYVDLSCLWSPEATR